MRICISILIVIVLLTSVSCSDPTSVRKYDDLSEHSQTKTETIENESSPNQTKESITLQIHTYGMPPQQQLMHLYQEKHSDVAIEITDFYSASDDGALDRYVQQTSVSLMAGTGPDVIDGYGLPWLGMAKSGLIHDLSHYIDNDPSFNPEEYYMNVIEAMRWNDGVFLFPVEFGYSALSINKSANEDVQEAFASLQTLDVYDAMDLYQQEAERSMDPDSFYFELANRSKAMGVLGWDLSSFLDPIVGVANLQSPQFMDLLERSKSLPYILRPLTTITDGVSLDEVEAKQALYRNADTLLLKIQRMLEFPEDRFSKPVLLTNSTGDIAFRASTYSISESCPNKEAAWELLRFLAQEEDEDYGTGYPLRFGAIRVPINRANFAAFATSTWMKIFQRTAKEAGWNVDGIPRKIDACMQRIDAWNQSVNCFDFYDKAFTDSVISANYLLFMDDEITAEEAAKRMQEKAVRYLDE